MRILSIDPGIRNLAYCVLETSSSPTPSPPLIIEWEVGDMCEGIKKPTFYQVSKSLVSLLHEKFASEEYDKVLIENVPSLHNPILKSVSMIIYSFFEIQAFQLDRECDVRMVSARNKLKVKHIPPEAEAAVAARTSNKYRQRKLLAIEYARHYLKTVFCDSEQLAKFEADKKRDDKADALLQACELLDA
jgi:hypothetical protein